MGTIAAFVGLFLGGALLGDVMARAFAPGSWIAEVAGAAALPLAFAIGLQTWYGLALLLVIPRVLAGLRARKVGPARVEPALSDPARPDPASSKPTLSKPALSEPALSRRAAAVHLPGSFVFLPFSSIAGAAAGLVVGIASPTHSAWLVTLLYWLVGTAHGGLAWRLARAGVLMPPESI
jgi:hypothetical protein